MIPFQEVLAAVFEPAPSINTAVLAVVVYGVRRLVADVNKLSTKVDAMNARQHRMHQETMRTVGLHSEDLAILKYKAGITTMYHPHSDAPKGL